MRIAQSSGLTRPKVASDLGVGLSTLNKWVQKHQHDDLMSGPHEDVEKENKRLRKEVRLLREEGWLYLAVILDLHSRRVIGWAVSNRMKRDLASLSPLERRATPAIRHQGRFRAPHSCRSLFG